MEKGIATQEPNATGVKITNGIAPAYMGCLTIAYGPVVITFCPADTSMVPLV
jgi:hypothetical protein